MDEAWSADYFVSSFSSSSLSKLFKEKIENSGWSHGLVVLGGDSCPEGCGFESLHCILYGHFSHLFVVKIVTFV